MKKFVILNASQISLYFERPIKFSMYKVRELINQIIHYLSKQICVGSERKYFILLLLILISTVSRSQSSGQARATRPKIGLTLSGGGAKGLAHIGILQALDSAGLKIDYITGTSMGSIMGAMYAIGYSGDSIEAISRSIDWNQVFAKKPELNYISIEEKSEYEKYAVEIPFFEGKFKIGSGFIQGQELWIKFSEVFHPVYNVTEFSKFSIPFKCIGTDLTTGNSVVMDHGNIVNAIRASMAIPTVFTPVKYDDKLLVDGGVVNNFPILDVKQMGADYVIGVSVSQGLLKGEELESALDILLQIGFFKDAETFEGHKSQCDLFITPDLKNYTTGSFDMADSIIDLGLITGRQYYPYFKKLADSLSALYPDYSFEKDRLPKEVKINISNYSIEGLNNTTSDFFFGLLNLPLNKNYSNKDLKEAVRRVYGSRFYKIINYDFLQMDSGKTELHFRVEEQYLTAVKFALDYNNFTKLGLKFNITTRDLILKESRALASIDVSENPRIYLEYYKYISKNRKMRLNLDCYGESVDFPVYDNFRLFEVLRSKFLNVGLSLQYNLNRSSYIGISQQRVFSKIKTVETPFIIYNGNNKNWYSGFSYVYNSVNNKYFATRGWYIKAEAGYTYDQDPSFMFGVGEAEFSSDTLGFNYSNYARYYVTAFHYSALNSKFTLIKNFTFAYLAAYDPYITGNFLGGGVNEIIRNQVPFVGLDESEVKTGNITTAQLGIQYNIHGSIYLTGRFNAGLYDFYNIPVKELTKENNLLTGYGLTLGINTPAGPIEATLMYCDQDKILRSHFRLGYNF